MLTIDQNTFMIFTYSYPMTMDFKKSGSQENNLAVFVGVKDAYLADSAVVVHYTLNGGYLPGSRDWVGLFKVGWTNQTEYFSYKYVINGNKDGGSHKLIEFSNSDLPSDDGCSYQFCYISSNKGIVGMSNSFEFKNDLIEDLVELDDNGEQTGSTHEGFITKDKFVHVENRVIINEAKLVTSTNKIVQLMEETESFRNEVKNVSKKYSIIITRIDEFEKTIAKLKKYDSEISKKISINMINIRSKRQEILKINDAIGEEQKIRSEVTKVLENQLLSNKSLSNEVAFTQERISELKGIVTGLIIEDEMLRVASEKACDKLAEQLGMVENEVSELEKKFKEKQIQNTKLCQDLSIMNADTEVLNRALLDDKLMADEFKSLYEKEMANHENTGACIEVTRSEIISLDEELLWLQEETGGVSNSLNRKIEIYKNASDRLNKEYEKHAYLSDNISAKRNEIQSLTFQIADHKREIGKWVDSFETNEQHFHQEKRAIQEKLDMEKSNHEIEMSKLNRQLSSVLETLEEANKFSDDFIDIGV